MADISAYLNPFQALAQGAAQGYVSAEAAKAAAAQKAQEFALRQAQAAQLQAYQQGQLKVRDAANQIRQEMGLGYTDPDTGEFHPGTVQTASDRAKTYATTQKANTDLRGRILGFDALKAAGLGQVPGSVALSFNGGATDPSAPPPDMTGPAYQVNSGLKQAQTDYLTQGRLPLILAQTDREKQMTPSMVSISNTKAADQSQMDAAGIKQKQAAALQSIMNVNTLPDLRRAQEGALGTNAGANAYRAQVYGQVAPVQAQAAMMNAGTNQGRLNLDSTKYYNPKSTPADNFAKVRYWNTVKDGIIKGLDDPILGHREATPSEQSILDTVDKQLHMLNNTSVAPMPIGQSSGTHLAPIAMNAIVPRASQGRLPGATGTFARTAPPRPQTRVTAPARQPKPVREDLSKVPTKVLLQRLLKKVH